MNKKAQLADIEFNPMYAALAVVGALISLVVMSPVKVGLLWKILTPIVTGIIGYFVVQKVIER